jgi:hypothetical protein
MASRVLRMPLGSETFTSSGIRRVAPHRWPSPPGPGATAEPGVDRAGGSATRIDIREEADLAELHRRGPST